MISVCLATHNGEKYIQQQLTSILQQIGDDDEIIISDDNSVDTTLEIILSINDKRITVLGPGYFNSPVRNFECALSHCRGDFIFLSDQDDIWNANKVQTVMAEFERGYDLINSNCSVVDHRLNVIIPSYFKFNNSRPGFFKNLVKNSFMGCCMAFNRKVLAGTIPFPPTIPMHDVWIGLIAEVRFKVKFIEEPLLLYRHHDSNASATSKGKSSYSFRKKMGFRITLIKNLFKRLYLYK